MACTRAKKCICSDATFVWEIQNTLQNSPLDWYKWRLWTIHNININLSVKPLTCRNEPQKKKKTVTSSMKHKAKLTHFLNFFLARWCASSPSDNVLRDCSGTWVRARSPPNQRTQTLSPSVTGPTSFPGHAGNPRAAPHTRSPSERPPDPSSTTLSVCATTVVHCQGSLMPMLGLWASELRVLQWMGLRRERETLSANYSYLLSTSSRVRLQVNSK
jgi:hypothetical protein